MVGQMLWRLFTLSSVVVQDANGDELESSRRSKVLWLVKHVADPTELIAVLPPSIPLSDQRF